MEEIINHTSICSLLYLGNTQAALTILEEKFLYIKQKTTFPQCKLFIQSLNLSIYNYILLKEGLSLYDCCLKNQHLLQSCCDTSHLYEIGCQIIYSYSRSESYFSKKSTNPDVQKALFYIHSHLSEPLTLESLCAYTNLSKCYFCTLFKNEIGFTFTQYLNQIRIQQAQKLLNDTQLSLSEIAFRCGFNNYSYFCTLFKKFTGYSPSRKNEGK